MLKIVLEPNETKSKFNLFPYHVSPTHLPTVVPGGAGSGKWAQQAAKRQAIIEKIIQDCKYKVGDTVKCHTLETQEMHGKEVVVEKLVTSYAQIRTDKWPSNDQPMLVHAFSRDKDMRFVCTTGYLIPMDAKEEG